MEKRQYVSSLRTCTQGTNYKGIPTSRQEEEVNGNSRKGEPGIPGKEGDYIVEWREEVGCTSLAGHAALRQDRGYGGILSPLNLEQVGLKDRFDAQENLQMPREGGLAGRSWIAQGSWHANQRNDFTGGLEVGPQNLHGCLCRKLRVTMLLHDGMLMLIYANAQWLVYN